MVPESHVSRFALLKKMSCFQSFVSVRFILFGLAACTWIDLFQLADRKWCFLRILSCVRIFKINQLRFSVFQFRNDQPHLKTPVSQMNITDHFMSYKATDSLNTFSDDCRTKVSYMKRFCNVWSTVVDDDRLRLFCCRYGKFLVCCHFL